MYKLKIKVTKEILRKSMMCGTDGNTDGLTQNCAIALAVREIFPRAMVNKMKIYLDSNFDAPTIQLSWRAWEFVLNFDSLARTPHLRLEMAELEFEVDLPQAVIDAVNISELEETLKTSETLELVKT